MPPLEGQVSFCCPNVVVQTAKNVLEMSARLTTTLLVVSDSTIFV